MLAIQPLAAQFAHTSHDARRGAMGGVFLPDTTRRFELAYRQDFLLASMADKLASVVMPVGRLGTAFGSYNHHGDLAYREQQASLAYMMQLSGWLHFGVLGRWMSIGVDDTWYDTQQWLGADAMVWANIGKSEILLTAGTRPFDNRHPWRGMAQVVWHPTSDWITALAIESDDRLRLRCGMEYSYERQLFFRAGMATTPMVITFGVGTRYGVIKMDIGAEMHSTLGISPCISMAMCF